MESTITIKGQITIPKAAREHLHVKPGDKVRFFLDPDGGIVLLPKLPASALRGMLKAKRHATLDEIEEGIVTGATETYARTRRK